MASEAKRWWIPPLLIGLPLAVAAGVFFFLRDPQARPAVEIPVLGSVGEFSLTSQRAQPFGSSQLKGRVWVANFIFTRCPSICPLLTQKMAKVQSETADLGSQLSLVSFTVDPEYDRPEVLAAYAQNHRASERWTFLTGDRQAVYAAAVEGMKVHMPKEPTDDLMALAHGAHFVLVDGEGRIRGYYNSEDAEAMTQLVREARQLASAASPKS